MKTTISIIAALLLSSCQSMNSSDPDSLLFNIPKGSTLSLNNQITLSHSVTHGVIQAGKEITDDEREFYDINCRLDFEKFGPRTIKPEIFTITRTEDGYNWVSQPSIMRFYTEVYLVSSKNTDIIKMVCQVYGSVTDYNFTVAEMQTALGDFITIKYASVR